jgi:hypothetical protein
MKNLKKIREENGAGEWGTPELTKKLKSETPGQDLDEAKTAETYTSAADQLSSHAMKVKSALAHRKAADAHTEASASHSRKADKLVKSGASPEVVSHHESMVKKHDQSAQRHRLHAHRFHSLGMKEEVSPELAESSIEDHETSMAFHHDKAQEAKKRGDFSEFERHLDIKHSHAIARDKINLERSKRQAKKTLHQEKVEEPTGDLKNACWKGYTAVGTKQKDGKTVPNCVPTEAVEDNSSEEIQEETHDYDVTVRHNHGEGKFTNHVYRVNKAVDHKHAGWIALGKHQAKHGVGQGVSTGALSSKKVSEGWEMPLPVEPESELQYTEDKNKGEDDGDNEGQMAKWQLEDLAQMAQSLADNLEDDDELEAWVQEHITTAHNALDDVYSYADSNDMDLDNDDDDDDDETPEDEDEMDYPESQNEAYHVVGATLSEPHHSMVTKRSETQMRKVKVKADSKEHAVQKAKSFYQKKGYKVHDTFHHSQVNEAAEQTEVEYDPNTPEEKKERMRLETLIRLGLLDRSLLPVIRRGMKKLEYGQNINAPIERSALFDLLQQLVGIVTGDDMIFRKVRLGVTRNKS